MLDIHKDIHEKLQYFINKKKIPNIIFHGESGCGKRTILYQFISNIYENNIKKMNEFSMFVECAHGKGIKFIREELKFFAKTNINCKEGGVFKSIILLNADKLTIDAQSALRRCIELFSHNTRFFIVVEDKFKLLRPILSRFCDIYIRTPEINGNPVNLYKYHLEKTISLKTINTTRKSALKKLLTTAENNNNTNKTILNLAEKLYEKGYCGLDLMDYIINNWKKCENNENKYRILLFIQKIKREFRNEKIFIFLILNFMFIRSDIHLENLLVM